MKPILCSTHFQTSNQKPEATMKIGLVIAPTTRKYWISAELNVLYSSSDLSTKLKASSKLLTTNPNLSTASGKNSTRTSSKPVTHSWHHWYAISQLSEHRGMIPQPLLFDQPFMETIRFKYHNNLNSHDSTTDPKEHTDAFTSTMLFLETNSPLPLMLNSTHSR